MVRRVRQLLIVAEDGADTNLALVGAASVGAYLRHHVQAWQATVLPYREGYAGHVILQMLDSTVDLVAVWVDPLGTADFGPLLDRFAVLWPDVPRLLMGPEIVTTADAERMLARHPGATAAVMGEAEQVVAELCHRVASPDGLRGDLPAGVALRDGAAYRAVPPRTEPVRPDRLVSPYGEGLIPPPRVGQRACLEISRGPVPFSPIPLDMTDWPIRPLPISRLREDLSALARMSPELLELIPGPVDANPVHFRWVLRALAEWEPSAPVRVTLSRPPDRALLAALRKAGVVELVFEPDVLGARGDRPRPRPTREMLRRIVDEGFLVRVILAVGHPADHAGEVERWFEYYASVEAVRMHVDTARVFPGHPLRASESAGPPLSGASFGATGDPTRTLPGLFWDAHHRVVAHGQMSSKTLARLQLQFGWVAPLFESFPASCRALVAVSGMRLRDLVVHLAALLDGGGHRVRSLAERRRFLRGAARSLLAGAGAMDRLPPVGALIDYEYWKEAPGGVFRVRKGVPYRVADLASCVLQRNPGQRLASFPYDVQALASGTPVDTAPVHPVFLLCRRYRPGEVRILRLEERWKAVLEQVDGSRTVADVVARLAPSGRRARLSEFECRETVLRLLEAHVLYVKAVRDGGDTRAGPESRRVLPFRPVLKKI